MAESVVTFFLEKLSELIAREASLLTGVDDKIMSLRNQLEWIDSFLKDADARQQENGRVKTWVKQVRDVAYDAEDVIDEFILKVECQRRRNMGAIGCCLSNTNQLKTLHDVGNQIEQIRNRLDQIATNKLQFGTETSELGATPRSTNHSLLGQRSRGHVVEEEDVVGFEDDAKTLVNHLTEGETRFHVISIVGMGGQGKTTLASKVYNSINDSSHFDCRAWIYLSEEPRFREVLMGVMKQIRVLGKSEEEELENMVDGEVVKKLYKYLDERRYLVVVDDIWTRKDWDNLKAIFPESKGSKVMLTTRNDDVAKHAKSITHKLNFLEEEECWELFRKKALSNSVTDVLPREVEEIGREIVAKCGGLPLAIIVLGGFLSRKDQIRSEWERVLKGINWQLEGDQEQISNILALSYNDLPYFLKPCFLYFGVFPENYEIPAKKLIQLWVAEGFVKPRGDGTMEEVAEDYLSELISRSMIRLSKRRSNGCVKTCRIHSLLREFAIKEAKEIKFLDVHRSTVLTHPTTARRLIIHGNIGKNMSLNCPTPHFRSLFQFNPPKYWDKLYKENGSIPFRGFRLLRVLDLPRITVELPVEIGEMIHLRYLGLRDSYLKRVPSTISNLINLQTLDVRNQYFSYNGTQPLPNLISKMDQLRHLYMNGGRISERFRFECLTNLQTLSSINVANGTEEGLTKLTNLRKLVLIRGFNYYKDRLSDTIVKLSGLHSLSLICLEYDTMPDLHLSNHQHLCKLELIGWLGKLPELHEFPPNLVKLHLENSGLRDDPMAMLEKLPHLKFLKLLSYAFEGKRMVCSAEGFSQLKELKLQKLDNLEEWKIEESAMSSLRRLEIYNCSKLKTLPELRRLTMLQELELKDMPSKFIARIHPGSGDDWYKVGRIPSIIVIGSGATEQTESGEGGAAG